MCELFAMSSLLPTSVGFSLERLARHGGAEGPHRDGWGVAYYAERDALLLREPQAASGSRLVAHIEREGPPSDLVISHIRLATVGRRSLANTQPFARELAGRIHVFAHNGDLPGMPSAAGGQRYAPVGETDSELAFCQLLEHLAPLWDGAGDVPPLGERLAVISDFAATLRNTGIANFLYADGDALFAHAHHRRRPGSDEWRPGLFILTRDCREAVPDLAGSGVLLAPLRQTLCLLASEPLTGENWRPMGSGELVAVSHGQIRSALSHSMPVAPHRRLS